MLISTRGRYALRVLVDMAEHRKVGEYVPLLDVAKRQEISEKYLENIVKSLVKAGIVEGLRGKGGGYRLTRDPDRICVRDALEACEGTLAPVSCLEAGARPCARMAHCRTLPLWQGLDQVISDYLNSRTIADLMQPGVSGDDYVI